MKKFTKEQLQDIIGDSAISRKLTAQKTAHIMERDDAEIIGFVTRSPDGTVGIIYESAVRWYNRDTMFKMMHSD